METWVGHARLDYVVQVVIFQDHEDELGARCVGAPIFDRFGKAVAAISVIGSTDRGRRSRAARYVSLAGDFDGDGKADPAAYRRSEDNWYLMPSSGVCPPVFDYAGIYLGHVHCKLYYGNRQDAVIRDFDGDGKADVSGVVWVVDAPIPTVKDCTTRFNQQAKLAFIRPSLIESATQKSRTA